MEIKFVSKMDGSEEYWGLYIDCDERMSNLKYDDVLDIQELLEILGVGWEEV